MNSLGTTSQTILNAQLRARLIAFYLPQYHPIPENDAWWGAGFTEWTNVTRAKPRFQGHEQPHLPADLGFYDLRLPEAREAQAILARHYGIEGFCYYHYWFQGRRLLERPFNEVLATQQPDFPFCLCWANEHWTRTWDGGNRQVLIAQQYSVEDHIRHIEALAPALRDPRYIRINQRALLLVYNTGVIPDIATMASIWRSKARELGVGELLLGKVESASNDRLPPQQIGFDVAIDFQPVMPQFGTYFNRITWELQKKLNHPKPIIYDYARMVQRLLQRQRTKYPSFPCVTPGWDNTARRKRGGLVLEHSHPTLYEQWLRKAIEHQPAKGFSERIVFINAWNEWAEGNHLEPCQRWGRAYLEATKRAVMNDQ